jgi:excisionase family DNA binding protein
MGDPALKFPNDETAEAAQTAVRSLDRVKVTQTAELRIGQVGGEEISVTLPADAVEMLLRVLSHLANGDAVSVVPVHAELTTQQAAELLGVSRPHLVHLLDDGRLPHRKVGTHRRVLLVDLLAYKERDREARRAVLDELTAEGQDLGLGY